MANPGDAEANKPCGVCGARLDPSATMCDRCGAQRFPFTTRDDQAAPSPGSGTGVVGPPAAAVPPGASPPGANPPGTYAPGANPPGAYPPGWYGASPPGPYAGYGYYPVPQQTNSYAIAALVLSIVSLCGIGSVLGIIFGLRARREIAASGGMQTGDGMALAGIIVGAVTLGLVVLYFVFIIVMMFVGANAAP